MELKLNESILIVEDESQDAKSIKKYLNNAGYSNVEWVTTFEEAFLYLKQKKFDAVLIDINLNDTYDGITLAGTIDSEFYLPYLFVTGQHHKSSGIFRDIAELKYKNFVPKPINEETLISNLKIVINTTYHIVQIGKNSKYNLRTQQVTIKGKEIILSEKEQKLLHILAENINKIVSKAHIIAYVWEDDPPKASSSLRELKRKLLNKFKEEKEEIVIENIFFRGYKLIF